MENKNPSLSQYFVNDPPSFFDELLNADKADPVSKHQAIASTASNVQNVSPKQPPSKPPPQQKQPGLINPITSNEFVGNFTPTEYIENSNDLESDIKVPDDVKNFWRPSLYEGNSLLTMPGLHSQNDLPDPIAIAVVKHLGDHELDNRKILKLEQVTQDERGIRTLIASGCYRAAANLTACLLTIYGQGFGRAGQPAKHSPHSLQLWFTRLALLAKLGEYELLQAEAKPFENLDYPDIYYEYYPEMYKDKTGSIASFSFRLLISELPIYFNKAQSALDRLSDLFATCLEIQNFYEAKNMVDALKFWKRRSLRILYSIINCALLIKKFNLIDSVIKDIILEKYSLTKEERRALFSVWGRIYLQVGDVFGAEQKFAEARRLREINSTPDLRDLVDKGLITAAQNDFPEAYAIFQKALHLESGNTMILNNMGVCLLYAGKLKDAILLYERAIQLNPQKALSESLLVNLSTLYELQLNNPETKKLELLKLINKFKPDLNISIEICLKLPALN